MATANSQAHSVCAPGSSDHWCSPDPAPNAQLATSYIFDVADIYKTGIVIVTFYRHRKQGTKKDALLSNHRSTTQPPQPEHNPCALNSCMPVPRQRCLQLSKASGGGYTTTMVLLCTKNIPHPSILTLPTVPRIHLASFFCYIPPHKTALWLFFTETQAHLFPCFYTHMYTIALFLCISKIGYKYNGQHNLRMDTRQENVKLSFMNWLGNSKADMASAIFRESWIKKLQTLSNSFTQLIGMLFHTVDWFMSFPTASLQLLTNKGQTDEAPTSHIPKPLCHKG